MGMTNVKELVHGERGVRMVVREERGKDWEDNRELVAVDEVSEGEEEAMCEKEGKNVISQNFN